MDPSTIALGIPIVAIVGGIGAGVFKQWLDYKREMLKHQRSNGSELNQSHNVTIEALRQEIMLLRDTTTLYDVSVERTLTELRQRMAHMESRLQIEPLPAADSAPRQTPPAYSSPQAEPTEQTITLGSSN